MTGLLFLFGLFLALGLFFLAVSIPRLLIIGIARAMLGDVKQEKKVVETIETYLMAMAMRLTKYIRMDEYKYSWMYNVLEASDVDLTPEVHQVCVFMGVGAIPLGMIPYVFLLPLLSPVVIIPSLLTYSKRSQKTDEWLKAERDEIEGELLRLVTTIEQEPRTSRSVIGMLKRSKGNMGVAPTGELDILLADMHSSNYEAVLTRLETRLSSPVLSDVVRGLIGVPRGDDDSVYFQMLVHGFKQLKLQRLKAQTQKIPPKIRVLSLAMLMCSLLTYLVITAYVTITSLGGMFQEKREATRLKERVESRPQSNLGMVTPGGYAFLTPRQTKEPLKGEDMKAYFGISGYDMMVSAEELLTQNVVNVKRNGVVCHTFADYIQKRRPGPPAPGQGMMMY